MCKWTLVVLGTIDFVCFFSVAYLYLFVVDSGMFVLFVVDLARSQGVDRQVSAALQMGANLQIPGSPGQFPTMTPNGIFWLRQRKRKMLGVERLALMGITNYDSTLSESKLCHLAGEAMAGPSAIPVIVAAEGYL